MTNLVDAAKSGDRRETLVAMRDILAKTIQECDSGRDMASNTKRLMEVTRQSFFEGIRYAKAGGRLYDISEAIQKYVEEKFKK